ncbi:MAG: hypothetical protein ABSF91_04820 [Bacteroidota bacterium]|jgi:PIN domain nuclease of toxin-antitoxin system
MSKELSLDEKVLLAAYDLEKNHKTPFSAEDLVIAAWKKFPDAFGLEGHGDEYPDSNRVFTKIMGDKGLRGRGWLLKVGEKLYQLSEAGKLYAESITEEENAPPSRSSLDRKQKDMIQHLLQSKAMQKVKNQGYDDVIFVDACSFWDISPRSTRNTLTARLTSTESLINRVKKLLAENKSLAIVHGGNAITVEDLTLLQKTHEFLIEKFQKELSIIRNRKDDRKFG